jgi:hypothetical protein
MPVELADDDLEQVMGGLSRTWTTSAATPPAITASSFVVMALSDTTSQRIPA